MKKKLFAMMISLAMAMSFTVPAFAEEFTELTDMGEYSADTTVTYTENSHYTINIPRTLDASMVTSSSPYYFTATQMDLAPDLHIEIFTAESTFQMENAKGNNITCTLYNANGTSQGYCNNCYGYFNDGELTSSEGFYITMPDRISTGTYTGVVTFNISMQTNF